MVSPLARYCRRSNHSVTPPFYTCSMSVQPSWSRISRTKAIAARCFFLLCVCAFYFAFIPFAVLCRCYGLCSRGVVLLLRCLRVFFPVFPGVAVSLQVSIVPRCCSFDIVSARFPLRLSHFSVLPLGKICFSFRLCVPERLFCFGVVFSGCVRVGVFVFFF
jgi:hypothetical protein